MPPIPTSGKAMILLIFCVINMDPQTSKTPNNIFYLSKSNQNPNYFVYLD